MCCFAKFIIKYVLLIVNLLFFLAGLTIVILGSVMLVNINALDGLPDLPAIIADMPIVVIVIGGIIMVIGFFGCCGAMRESKCLLYCYIILVLILTGISIWMTVEIFRNLSNLEEWVNDWIQRAFNLSNLEPFEIIQNTFSCCGTTGIESYFNIISNVPSSCCPSQYNVCDINNSYGGCRVIVSDFFETFGSIIGGFFIAIIAAQVVAVVFAIFIAHYPKKSSNSY